MLVLRQHGGIGRADADRLPCPPVDFPETALHAGHDGRQRGGNQRHEKANATRTNGRESCTTGHGRMINTNPLTASGLQVTSSSPIAKLCEQKAQSTVILPSS